jgi:hypothetical protein
MQCREHSELQNMALFWNTSVLVFLNMASVQYRNSISHTTTILVLIYLNWWLVLDSVLGHLQVIRYRVQQKYLTIWQNSCQWNCWRGEFVLERSYSETQSISVVMERWSVEHRAFAVETYFKNKILSWLRGYFVGTSIFIGTGVPSCNTSSSEDIWRARCTKRNQGQRWIWNRTSGKKWQQFLPTCCNEW